MFGLGMMEILMILAIALIVVGPQKLPELARTLGKAMGEFKRSAQDLKRSMDVETTVKDIVDIPKTDLKEILSDSGKNETDETVKPNPYPEDVSETPAQQTTTETEKKLDSATPPEGTVGKGEIGDSPATDSESDTTTPDNDPTP